MTGGKGKKGKLFALLQPFIQPPNLLWMVGELSRTSSGGAEKVKLAEIDVVLADFQCESFDFCICVCLPHFVHL